MTSSWMGDDFRAQLQAAIEEGLEDGGKLLRELSNEISPTLTSKLDDSGRVEVSGHEAAVGYEAEHSLKQHEAMAFKHPRGGRPKFLEDALINNSDAILDKIADPIERVLKG